MNHSNAQSAAEVEAEYRHVPGERKCFCGVDISLQSVSGGAHPNGVFGSVWLRVNGESVEYVRRKPANGNPAGTPGAKVDVSRLSPDLPPPFDSQEEAQRAAGIWPQEAEPATVRVKPSALDEMAAQAASWRDRWVAAGTAASQKFKDVADSISPSSPIQGVGEMLKDAALQAAAAFDMVVRPAHTGVEASFLEDFAAQLAAPDPELVGQKIQGRIAAALGAPYAVGVDLARDGADAMAYMLRSARKPAPAPTGIDATLAERGSRYGKFKDHAKITQDLKDVMRACPKWSVLTPSQKEALEMVVHKIGRILNGDPNYDDSWVDVAGYSKLVADELQGVSR